MVIKEAEIWDLETVTAADYSCEVQLSPSVCMEIVNSKTNNLSLVSASG